MPGLRSVYPDAVFIQAHRDPTTVIASISQLIRGLRDATDPESGERYTVKRYESTKSVGQEGWRHESIRLIPDNPDRERYPILEFTPEDAADLRVVAEFIQAHRQRV
jgi:hypothetical protein